MYAHSGHDGSRGTALEEAVPSTGPGEDATSAESRSHRVNGEFGPAGERVRSDDAREPAGVSTTVLLAPFAVSVTYVGVAATVGPEPFDTGAAGATKFVAYGALGLLLHLSAYATARLYAAAERESDRTGEWRPDSRLYVGGGALALLAARVVEVLVTGRPIDSPIVYVLGNAVVALPLASIVAGPIYWLRRRRHHRRLESTA
ncbi:hypothetical protein ACFQGT_09505 [Natrialbaceae archaeon GCM10025810]|uniref:hypothetical protein n=1 Tax=Halovalidus salilacus TaxID=3075124 RepID=UPI00361F7282